MSSALILNLGGGVRAGSRERFLEWRIQDPTETRLGGSIVEPGICHFTSSSSDTDDPGIFFEKYSEHTATEYWIMKDEDFGQTLHILILGGKGTEYVFHGAHICLHIYGISFWEFYIAIQKSTKRCMTDCGKQQKLIQGWPLLSHCVTDQTFRLSKIQNGQRTEEQIKNQTNF